MLIDILGVIIATGMGLFWLYAIILGVRDGVIRQRIAIRSSNDQVRYLEGLQAKLWGWALVVVGGFFVLGLLWVPIWILFKRCRTSCFFRLNHAA